MVPIQSKLRSAVRAAIYSSVAISSLGSVSLSAAEAAKEDQDKIVITGSRISRADSEGATTVISITSEQMEKDGFANVYDALISVSPHTGGVQGEQFSNSFTPNAQMVNLRGFGPNRTLILIDGRRMADYPMPFNGESNFVNLAQIPTAMVERVEILLGGASAIYGSDAIAGVINIITKKEMEGWTASLRLGTTSQGGGDSERLQVYGGKSYGDFSYNAVIEVSKADPIFGKDREFLDDPSDNPLYDSENFFQPNAAEYFDYFDIDGDGLGGFLPSATACEALGLTATSTPVEGDYCTRNTTGDESIRNQRDRASFFTQMSYDLGNFNEVYGSFAFSEMDGQSANFRPWWTSGIVYDATRDTFVNLIRSFSPEEMNTDGDSYEEQTFDFNTGFKGLIADEYDYQIDLTYSKSEFERVRSLFITQNINQYFLGDSLGIDPYFGIYPAFSDANPSTLFTPLNDATRANIVSNDRTFAEQSKTTVSFSMTGELMDLGNDVAEFATIVEWSSQEYAIELNEQLVNGELFNTAGTGGEGERDRYAAGIETRWPVADTFTLIASGRYDKYVDDSNVDDAFTYNFGGEFRPTDGILLRFNQASSFRAPDMHYMYANESGFFLNTPVKDAYRCETEEPNVALADCSIEAFLTGTRQGSLSLEEETGYSRSVGFVYEPVDSLSMSVDIYQLSLDNMVKDLDITNLLQKEADCRQGRADVDSVLCQQILSSTSPIVDRDANGNLFNVDIYPLNTAVQEQTGIDISFRHAIETSVGTWRYSLNYSHTLESVIQEFADSERLEDWRDDLSNGDLRSRLRGNFGWSNESWNVNLFLNRMGSTPNFAQTGRLGSWTTANLFVQHQFETGVTLQLTVNNLADENPAEDNTYSEWPFFNRSQYNAIGREIFVEAKMDF